MKKTNVVYMILIISIVCIIGLFFLQKKTNEGFMVQIPKTIWTYWDNPNTIPESVQLCMKSWKKYNPDYTIQMLTKENYRNYVSIPDSIAKHPLFNDMPQRFADLVRIYVVAEKGGVWCDSSNLMTQPLSEWIIQKPGIEFYGFSIVYGNIHDRLPIIENWFFVAPPASPFMQKWRDEFTEISKFKTHSEYVQSRIAMGTDLREYGSPEYLAMHVAAQKVLQIDKYPLEKLSLQSAIQGPFLYIDKVGWNSYEAVKFACSHPEFRKPFVKMRGPERNVLEQGLNGEFSNEKCRWV